jgi:hypothetical protein
VPIPPEHRRPAAVSSLWLTHPFLLSGWQPCSLTERKREGGARSAAHSCRQPWPRCHHTITLLSASETQRQPRPAARPVRFHAGCPCPTHCYSHALNDGHGFSCCATALVRVTSLQKSGAQRVRLPTRGQDAFIAGADQSRRYRLAAVFLAGLKARSVGSVWEQRIHHIRKSWLHTQPP